MEHCKHLFFHVFKYLCMLESHFFNSCMLEPHPSLLYAMHKIVSNFHCVLRYKKMFAGQGVWVQGKGAVIKVSCYASHLRTLRVFWCIGTLLERNISSKRTYNSIIWEFWPVLLVTATFQKGFCYQ